MKTAICAIFLLIIEIIHAQLYGVKEVEPPPQNEFLSGMFGMETFSNVKRMGDMTEEKYRKLMKEYTKEYFQVILGLLMSFLLLTISLSM